MFQRCRIVATNEHAGPLLNQSLGNTQPNAPGSTCYQRNLLPKFLRHMILPFFIDPDLLRGVFVTPDSNLGVPP